MKIQRNFYDEAKADIERNEQRPIAEEVMQRHNGAMEKTHRRLKEETQHYKKVLNPDKCVAFEVLARRALELAKLLCVNITAKTTENGIGFILLESDMFTLDRRDSREYAQTIAELFTTADDIIYFIPDDALPRIQFTFILYSISSDRNTLENMMTGKILYEKHYEEDVTDHGCGQLEDEDADDPAPHMSFDEIMEYLQKGVSCEPLPEREEKAHSLIEYAKIFAEENKFDIRIREFDTHINIELYLFEGLDMGCLRRLFSYADNINFFTHTLGCQLILSFDYYTKAVYRRGVRLHP